MLVVETDELLISQLSAVLLRNILEEGRELSVLEQAVHEQLPERVEGEQCLLLVVRLTLKKKGIEVKGSYSGKIDNHFWSEAANSRSSEEEEETQAKPIPSEPKTN